MSREAPSPPAIDPLDTPDRRSVGSDGDALSLEALLESLLFVADGPVAVGRLVQTLGVTLGELEAALATLQAACADRGVRLQRAGGWVQFISAPEAAPHIERFLGLELHSKLSPAALESLAVVAYQQPVTRAQVEAVRGVNSDSALRTLIGKGLIEEVGRLDAVGRPILYGTTLEFLQFFGLESLDDLPALE